MSEKLFIKRRQNYCHGISNRSILETREARVTLLIVLSTADGFMNAAGYEKIHMYSPCPLKLEQDDGRLSLFISEKNIASSPNIAGSGVLSVCVLLQHNGGSR